MIEPRPAVRNTVVVRQRIHVECIVTDYILNHTRPLRLLVSMELFNARARALIKDKGSEISILVKCAFNTFGYES